MEKKLMAFKKRAVIEKITNVKLVRNNPIFSSDSVVRLTLDLGVRVHLNDYNDRLIWIEADLSDSGFLNFWINYSCVDSEFVDQLALINKQIISPLKRAVESQHNWYSLDTVSFSKLCAALRKLISPEVKQESTTQLDMLNSLAAEFDAAEFNYKSKRVQERIAERENNKGSN